MKASSVRSPSKIARTPPPAPSTPTKKRARFSTLSTTEFEDRHERPIGVDEAGRGPLAGPVVVAACLLKPGFADRFEAPELLQDSKRLTSKRREFVYEALVSSAYVEFQVEIVSPQVIDEINILQATLKGMGDAALALKNRAGADYAFVDGNRLPTNVVAHQKGCPEVALKESEIRGEFVIKGDAKVQSIAAASIIAKVTRDRLLLEYHEAHPEYGFEKHKGYGTKQHIDAIKLHGPCAIHRRTFKPISTLFPLESKEEIK